MDTSQLLTRLTEIERAIGAVDAITLRRMVIETQEYVLQSQKEGVEDLRRKHREQIPVQQSDHSAAPQPGSADKKIRRSS